MTTHDRDKVIAAAKEARIDFDGINNSLPLYVATAEEMERFYSIAFEAGSVAEREECAKVCENNYWSEEIDWWLSATKKDVSAKAARKCAEAIRARGDTK